MTDTFRDKLASERPSKQPISSCTQGRQPNGRAIFATLWQDIGEVFQLARRERLTVLIGILLALMVAGSIVFFAAEFRHNPNVNSYPDALYWSIISITTVGYGDLAPVTGLARTASVVMVLSFMALMPLVGATVTSIYVAKKIKEEAGLEKVTATGHILICGWNNNGYNILAGFREQQETRVVVIVAEIDADHFENIQETYPELNLHFVRGKYTTEAVLHRANVSRAKSAVVLVNYSVENTLRSDEQAVLAVLTLRELCPNIHIVAECFASAYRGHLRRAGANRVIVSGELDGFMLTAAALSPGLDTSIKDALTFGTGNDLWTVAIPPEFMGRTFKELATHWLAENCWLLIGLIQERRQLGISDVLTGDTTSINEFIVRRFEQAGRGAGGSHHLHHVNPGPDHVIQENDVAIVIYPREERSARSS